MKILAIIANFGWLIFFIYLLIKDFPKTASDIAVVSLLFFTILLNLAVLIFFEKSRDWLSLYLKRKALEEQKKIDALAQKDERKSN